METFAVQLKNITKTFGSVVANHDVSLDVRQGEILALLGENGSGKTTLMNMLSGIYRPDSGSICIDGREVSIQSPEDAKRLGIGMVHQHFKLVDIFTAADNIWMGMGPTPFGLREKCEAVDARKGERGFFRLAKKTGLVFRCAGARFKGWFLSKKRNARVAGIVQKFGFELDPAKKVYDMSVSEKQTLEIVKVLTYGARIIVLDEPTAVLTVQEIEKLFAVMRRMKESGHAIIIITHKLNEVMEISDRVAIMRKGESVGVVNTADTDEQQLTELMVGHKVDLKIRRPEVQFDRPLLEVRDLTVRSDEGSVAVDKVSFYIRGGEILGVAGISGCGQRELCEAIAGLRKVESGRISHEGKDLVGLPPREIIAEGISMSFIPEDRLGMGLAPSLSIADNMCLKDYGENKWNPVVNRKKARAKARYVVEELGVVTPSIETPVRRLSGGNVQKVLVGREIIGNPNVIVTAYPVRGLDINSSYAIYDILNLQKEKGVGILFVGEDLDVMLELCDKILVLCHGRVMGVVHAQKTSKEELGLMMTGSLDLVSLKADKHLGIARDSGIDDKESA